MPAPLPAPVGLAAEWYAHLARGELRFQRCTGCGRWRHPPRHLCAACGADEWEWTTAKGTGTLFSWTVTHRATHPAFADAVPYPILVVELDEQVRIVSGLRGLAPDQLRLGLSLRAEIDRVDDAIGLVYFRPT